LKTLFNTKFNWLVFLGMAILIRLLFIDISWISYLAVILALHQFTLLFNSIGYVMPVRYLLGAFMCVQFFIGPALAYNGLDQYQYINYKMKIPEADYFAYAIPAVLSFIIGLHLFAGKLNGEIVDQKQVGLFVKRHPELPYWFIGIGFVTSIVSGFFGSELAFVFYLLGGFKFIGLFLLIIGSKELKVLPLIVVVGSIVASSLGDGMFHDLLTWLIFIGSIFALRYKFGFNVKLIACISFIFFAVAIQVIKSSYRIATSSGKEEAGVETFSKLSQEQSRDKGIFNFEILAPTNVRINQGFIITNIMLTVPAVVPYSNGEEMYRLFEAGVLPRVLAPNKLKAGDRTIFMKYSGMHIRTGTSMGLSSLGDAYLNFGIIGGCVFMFLLGLMYSGILQVFYKKGKTYPVLLLFTALVFYYPIRPDCELQTILGHLFKSCFLIFVMITLFKNTFRVEAQPTQ
jgi:O-antigen polysaccharide polymerase Wzy